MSLAGGDTALIGNSKPDGKGNLVKLNARHSDHYYDHHHHDDEVSFSLTLIRGP